MKTTLTDHYSGRKLEILYKDKYLPAFGRDGIEYMILSNMIDEIGEVRRDCTIVDADKGMALKPCLDKEKQPIKFELNTKAFAESKTIEGYIAKIKK